MIFRFTVVVVCFLFSGHAAALTGSGESSVGAITTVLPSFADLQVEPNRAGPGETVWITFSVSVPLGSEPVVLVGGNEAAFISLIDGVYVYRYLVRHAAPGPITITIDGSDPLGNSGNLSSDLALEVIEGALLPLHRWPALLALLAAGVLAVLRTGRYGRASRTLLVLLLLGAPMAAAQGPTVTNVSFVQQPAGAGGTEVIITFDIESPNGPSDISVALSKDGGADGFAFPVTSITGDIEGVATGTNKQIAWDVAADYPNEHIPLARIRVTADDSSLLPPPVRISVAAGTFTMGGRQDGDDALYGADNELPRRELALSAYEIGKFEVTNQEVCNVFNWANEQGYFTTVNASTAKAFGHVLLDLGSPHCHIEYSGGAFTPVTRTGLPGSTAHSMADHPVQSISWYGAAAYCNWLSEIGGLTPVYDTNSWSADFTNDGFHLPTEAQWERAAAWDGDKHWTYGFTSHTLQGNNRANYFNGNAYVNPLGLATYPYTSPVGWFDGVRRSPNANAQTVNSKSPAGCYDMSGNVAEWCHDWYDPDYYTTGGPPWSDPAGPAAGSYRVVRGGSWAHSFTDCRTANRDHYGYFPAYSNYLVGFRVARTP